MYRILIQYTLTPLGVGVSVYLILITYINTRLGRCVCVCHICTIVQESRNYRTPAVAACRLSRHLTKVPPAACWGSQLSAACVTLPYRLLGYAPLLHLHLQKTTNLTMGVSTDLRRGPAWICGKTPTPLTGCRRPKPEDKKAGAWLNGFTGSHTTRDHLVVVSARLDMTIYLFIEEHIDTG